MNSSKKRLGDLLLSLKLITPTQLEEALWEQKQRPARLGQIMVRKGFITDDLLLNALAAQIGVWPWRLEESPPTAEALNKIPEALCKQHSMLPVSVRGDLLLVAMVDPQDLTAIDGARNATGMRIEPVLANADRMKEALEKLYGGGAGATTSTNFDKLVDRALEAFSVDGKLRQKARALCEEDTRPVVGLVNQILSDAIRFKASDVHIEPKENAIEVRYRVDGMLQIAQTFPSGLMPMLTTRLKIMSELDIVETRLPQDGRFGVTLEGRVVDMRVSVLPTQHGGRIVLRILDKMHGVKRLSEIGFDETKLGIFRQLVFKPYGMFLVTGPTGSGKTTTLYAALQELVTGSNNVMTCEDPIEYELAGVSQSQVSEKVGLTFARQLRAILRQDPDIILVGEIRDVETADIAIRAAQTGHMVLSSLHCNDVFGAIPRLLDLGVPNLLLSNSLVGIMSQRLVRKLCKSCRQMVSAKGNELALFQAHGVKSKVHYTAKGCPSCSDRGYRGRMAVTEMLPISREMVRHISKGDAPEDLREIAIQEGFLSMQHDALHLVATGQTSLDEAHRVLNFDDILSPRHQLAA